MSAARRLFSVVLALLSGTACGGMSDPEDSDRSSGDDPIDPATLDCNAPLPEQLLPEMGGLARIPPPLSEATPAGSLGIAEPEARAGHSMLAINPQVYPYKVYVPEHCVPLGQEFVATLRICVDAAGVASGVTILKSSLPIIDSQFPYVIARWRYQPYLVEGQPTPFCYNMNYRVV